MELKNEQQLPAFVLAELYGKSLVFIDEEIKPKKVVVTETKKSPKQYLGDYQKKIIVLVNDEENIYVSDESLQFLSGILSACKLNLAHIALMNFNINAVSFSELKKELKPGYLLLFGINALQIELPFAMPDYQVQEYDNCKILVAPSLADLNNSSAHAIAEKKKLWKSLQKMFNLEK